MSMVERGSNPGLAPPRDDPGPGLPESLPGEMNRTLAAALGRLRDRVLARVGLRWYWSGALLLDAAAVLALLFLKPVLTLTAHALLTIALLLTPVAAAVCRCLAVRLPLAALAKLMDQRAGLQERVASAVEASSGGGRRTAPFMSALLARDAVDALATVDVRELLPIKRDAVLASLALAATLALCLRHAPAAVEIPVAVSGGALPSALDKLLGERQVAVAPPSNRRPAAPPSSKENAPASDQDAKSAQQTRQSDPSSPAAAHAASGAKPSAGNGSSRQPSAVPGAGKPPASQSAGRGGTSTNSSARPKGSNQAHSSPARHSSSSQPSGHAGQSGGHAGSAAQRPPQGRSAGAGEFGQKPGQGQSGSRSGQGSARKPPQGGARPRAGARGNAQRQGKQASQPSHGSGGAPGQGKTGQGGSQGAQQGGRSAGGASGPREFSAAGNGGASSGGQHPGAPNASGGSGKPLPARPRSLADVPNRSHFSFRLPKSSNGALRSAPNRSGALPKPDSGSAAGGGSKVPYGDGQASGAGDGNASQAQAVEQNPRIPAAYRFLVKRYFAAPAGRSR